MGYRYQIKCYYTVKNMKRYPWPSKVQPDRDIEVFNDDVLVRKGENLYDMHTGIYKVGIQIPDEDTIFHEETCHLGVNL